MSDRASAPAGQVSGLLISTPHEGGPVVVTDTVSCCHCGRVWLWQPGSGRQRGWCGRCHGITCGSRRCDHCVPQEQQLENMERNQPLDFRPILGRVEGDVPR